MNKREQLIDQLLKDLDAATNGAVRFISSRTSRRSFLGKFGTFLAGMGALPILPVVRDAHAQSSDDIPDMGNPDSCEYWRYCAFSGQACSCCGGTVTQCPPGSETATVAWVCLLYTSPSPRD